MSLAIDHAGELRARWRWPSTRADLAEPASAFTFALDLLSGLERRRAELSRNDDLTPTGVARATRGWIVEGGRHQNFIAALGRMADAGARIAAERAALAVPRIDRSDLIGELQRQEVRAHLRNLSPAIQAKTAIEDPAAAEAILSGPKVLFELPDDAWQNIRNAFAEHQHAPRLAELADREEAIKLARSAQELTLAQIETAAELGKPDFYTWWSSGREPDDLPPSGQMARAAFDQLPPAAQVAKIRRGLVVVDD